MKQEEIKALLQQDGPTRYKYFVKRVVAFERAWGLWNDGWALADDDTGHRVFPLWPAAEYAQRCAIESWSDYRAEEITLDDLLEELVPKLRSTGVKVGIFPTPGGQGVTLALEEFARDLMVEQERYRFE